MTNKLLPMLVVCILLFSTAGAKSKNETQVNGFISALDQCVKYYQTYGEEGFEGWGEVKPLKRTCQSCSTILGELAHPDSFIHVEISHITNGPKKGLRCSSSRLGAPYADEVKSTLNRWVNSGLKNGSLKIISEPRFPNEQLKVCRTGQAAGLSFHLEAQGKLSFVLYGGEPTGRYYKGIRRC